MREFITEAFKDEIFKNFMFAIFFAAFAVFIYNYKSWDSKYEIKGKPDYMKKAYFVRMNLITISCGIIAIICVFKALFAMT